MAAVVKRWVREDHPGGPPIEFPLAEASGSADGPTVAVVAGMHGGEYAGMLAAGKVIQRLEHLEVRGRIIIIPILSIQAAFRRSMQLSPIDEREVHYQWPNRDGSYSEHLVELLLRTLGKIDALLDLHAGEFAQDLTPHIGVPWITDDDIWKRSLELARAFDVPYLSRRAVRDTPLALPLLLLEAGVPNIWSEIGHNGLPQAHTVALQYGGVLNALRVAGALAGKPVRFRGRVIGPKRWSLVGEDYGLWRPAVRSGQHVKTGQLLGELFDVFGARIKEYRSPGNAVVLWVCTSPPIDPARRPHGNNWHSWLMNLVEDRAR
jgi:predicted deacylase